MARKVTGPKGAKVASKQPRSKGAGKKPKKSAKG
jgi:hypothetical protein